MFFSSPVLLGAAVQMNKKEVGMFESLLPPEDISLLGHKIEALFQYTTVLNILFFILFCIGLFGFSYIYHYKRHPKPEYTYGNKKVHILVATVIGAMVFLGIDMNITRMSNNDYLNYFIKFPDEQKEDVVRIQIMAQQWAWNFRYPGKDNVFNTEDDVVLLNDLRLPIDKKVVVQMISKDVIHSFYLPNVRRKVDVIPGRLTRMWFQLTKTGEYDIACAEMCGTYHYRMKARLTSYSQEDYLAWLSEAQEKAAFENQEIQPERYWGWKWQMAGSK
jgi:cytochrome c oxidase subunit 2